MQKSLFVLAALMLAGSLVAADGPKSPAVKKIREHVTFSQDVKVGSTMLKSGTYEVTSNGPELTFRHVIPDVTYPDEMRIDLKEKPVVVPCTVTPLATKADGTEMDMPVDSSGVHVLKTLTLAGTNVTFTIGQ